MKYNELAKTGIKVSELAFGSLTLSPLQKNLSQKESEVLLKTALDYGINFFDTAEFYNNYYKLSSLSNYEKHNIIVCSKSYAYSKTTARASVQKALKELKRDYIDIFCLHEQESDLTLKGHMEALEELQIMKEEKLIRAIGVSTHFVKCLEAVMNYPFIDIVQTITNYKGLGIVDGTKEDMENAISTLRNNNKAVYGMKVIGGGSFHNNIMDAFYYIKKQLEIDSFALGFGSKEEIEFAIKYFYEDKYDENLNEILSNRNRGLHVANWCTACSMCVKKCSQNALKIVNGKASVDENACVLCGYCIGVCPEFCIKIY
jgi:predicted aldo/keto reductase-like oxidoreductase